MIVVAEAGRQHDAVKKIIEQAGAESIDSAREDWWIGLRDVEKEHYAAQGLDFDSDEPTYRRGFEAALRPEARGKTYDEAVNLLFAQYPDDYGKEAFKRGFERGRKHNSQLLKRFEKSA